MKIKFSLFLCMLICTLCALAMDKKNRETPKEKIKEMGKNNLKLSISTEDLFKLGSYEDEGEKDFEAYFGGICATKKQLEEYQKKNRTVRYHTNITTKKKKERKVKNEKKKLK